MPKRLYVKLPKEINNMTQDEIEQVAPTNHQSFTNSVSYDDVVKVFGSSMTGRAFGLEALNKANVFLSGLLAKGKIKCWTKWCRACSLYKLDLADGVVGHVVQISFSNVTKLSEVMNFQWEWDRPDSDWAKSNGKASQVFERMVKDKSKPVWYAQIQSEENVMKLLGANSINEEEVSIVKIYNKILKGGSFEESGFSEKYRVTWDKLVSEIANRPEGTIPWPISDL